MRIMLQKAKGVKDLEEVRWRVARGMSIGYICVGCICPG